VREERRGGGSLRREREVDQEGINIGQAISDERLYPQTKLFLK